MELRHLRYFVAVGTEEHLGRAAKILNISQPALTRQIQNLEREIDVQLLDRLLRGVRLTPAGRSYLEDARKILADVERATKRAQRVDRGQIGVIKIGFNEVSSWFGLVPKSFHRFRLAQPDVELELKPMMSLEQIDRLDKGEIDACFMYLRPADRTGLDYIRLQTEHFVLAVPASNPLASRASVTLAELQGEQFVWLRRAANPMFHDRLLEACRSKGLHPHIIQEADSEGTLLSLISVGMGIGIVTTGISHRRPGSVVLLPVSDLDFSLELELVWNRNAVTAPLQRFIDTVRTMLAEEAAEAPGKEV